MEFLRSILGAVLLLLGVYLGMRTYWSKAVFAVWRGEGSPPFHLLPVVLISWVLDYVGLWLLEIPLFINLPILVVIFGSFGFGIAWRDPKLSKTDRIIWIIIYSVIVGAVAFYAGHSAYTNARWAAVFPLYRIK